MARGVQVQSGPLGIVRSALVPYSELEAVYIPLSQPHLVRFRSDARVLSVHHPFGDPPSRARFVQAIERLILEYARES